MTMRRLIRTPYIRDLVRETFTPGQVATLDRVGTAVATMTGGAPPACPDCQHFVRDHGTEYGKCRMFMEVNLATGNFAYLHATSFREDRPDRCGPAGHYFDPRK